MSVLPRPMGVVPRVPVSPAPAGAGALCRTVSLPHPTRFVNYFWHRVFDVPFFTPTQPLREYWCASCLPPSQQCRNALSPATLKAEFSVLSAANVKQTAKAGDRWSPLQKTHFPSLLLRQLLFHLCCRGESGAPERTFSFIRETVCSPTHFRHAEMIPLFE